MASRQGKQRLGKGLSALLGEYAGAEADDRQNVEAVPVDALQPNPFQPRRDLGREALDELIASIQDNGLLQPLVVRPDGDGGWEIVAGERRWRAVSELGWSRVPAVVRDVDDGTMLVLALVENLQREELTPLEEARAFRRLVDEFELTQAEVAERVGRDRSTVANAMRLLALPEPVQELLAAGSLRAGHARALLGLDDDERCIELAREAARKELSVREVERRVRRDREGPAGRDAEEPATPTPEEAYARRAEQALARALGTAVHVRLDAESRGCIEIAFHDADDFERVVESIVGVGGIV